MTHEQMTIKETGSVPQARRYERCYARAFGLLALLTSLFWLSVQPANAQISVITVRPGDDVQAMISAAPEGARFRFEKGIYRGLSLEPKAGQKFFGSAATVLNGARVLTDWEFENGYWVHRGLPDPLPIWDERWGTAVAQAREDLFVDNVLLRRVGSLAKVTPRTWYFDDNAVYMRRNPTGRLVEYGVVPWAFFGRAANVEIHGFRIEKYAPRTHQGAVFGTKAFGWKLYNLDAQWNHAAGAVLGSGGRVYGGRFNNNGQLGLRLSGEDILLEGADIAYNNYAGFKQNWEAGGVKFSGEDVIIRNNHVHHNTGKGIWADVDAARVIVEKNYVYNNDREGITYEISHSGVIRDNYVIDNGVNAPTVWLWGAGIIISNSRDTEVFNNTIVINAHYGNGIAIIHKNRAKGKDRIAVRNKIYDNTIIHMGAKGMSGAVADADHETLRTGNNLFDKNTYILPSDSYRAWMFYEDRPSVGRAHSDPTKLGMEKNGQFVFTARPGRFVDPAILKRLRR